MGLGGKSRGCRDGGKGQGSHVGRVYGAHGVRRGGGVFAAFAGLDGHVCVRPPLVFLVLVVVLVVVFVVVSVCLPGGEEDQKTCDQCLWSGLVPKGPQHG